MLSQLHFIRELGFPVGLAPTAFPELDLKDHAQKVGKGIPANGVASSATEAITKSQKLNKRLQIDFQTRGGNN